jgi:hypothetical protein
MNISFFKVRKTMKTVLTQGRGLEHAGPMNSGTQSIRLKKSDYKFTDIFVKSVQDLKLFYTWLQTRSSDP